MKYEFDYSIDLAVDVDIEVGRRGRGLPLIVPAMRVGGRTIAEGLLFYECSNREQPPRRPQRKHIWVRQ